MSTGSSLLLRPALEAAMVVARNGETAEPVQPAPALLRPYLRFARLPGPALEVARRVLDDDEAFRARVAAATTADELGQAAWLWLTRPEGWEAALERLKREAQELEVTAREEKADRDARRRLSRAEDAARRAEVAIAAKQREVDAARAEAGTERAARQAAEGEVAQLRTHLPNLRDERNRAVRKMKEFETELANRSADLRHARHQLRMLEAELEHAREKPSDPAGPVAREAEPAAAVPPAPLDRDGVARAVGVAAAAAQQLSAALADASASLAAPAAMPGSQPPAAERQPRRSASSASRQSRALPPGIFDDSAAAAAHLAGLPGVVVVVDGYNVSQTAWPGISIAEQRGRLVDACAELHARTGAQTDLVFDGADPQGYRPPTGRAGVRVRFSPPGVEADEVVVDLVDDYPAARPVVVASSDRRVREEARRRGANVVSAPQLLGLLRR